MSEQTAMGSEQQYPLALAQGFDMVVPMLTNPNKAQISHQNVQKTSSNNFNDSEDITELSTHFLLCYKYAPSSFRDVLSIFKKPLFSIIELLCGTNLPHQSDFTAARHKKNAASSSFIEELLCCKRIKRSCSTCGVKLNEPGFARCAPPPLSP